MAMACAVLASSAAGATAVGGERRALVLGGGFPGVDAGFESAVVTALEERGFAVTVTDGADLRDKLSAPMGARGTLVLPNARSFPTEARQALLDFLQADGSVVLFGGPAFSRMLLRHGSKWISTDDVAEARAKARTGPNILDLSKAGAWDRSHDDNTQPGSISVDQGPEGAGPAAKMSTKSLGVWDTLMPPPVEAPFVEGATLTAFWAKGSSSTPQMMVEWREKDGSRWIATVDLSTEWRRHVLSPTDFRPWPAPSDKRVFDPRNADRVSFGIARSHNSLPTGEHSFWVAGISTGPDPLGEADFSPPSIESIAPAYKTFRMEAASLSVETEHIAGIFEGNLKGRADVACQIWRTRGLGCRGERGYRWAPLLMARSRKGGLGVAAAFTLFRRGAVAYFGIDDPAFVSANATLLAKAVANAASRLTSDPFLYCAGSDAFSAWEDGPAISLGAVVKGQAQDLRAEFTVTNLNAKKVFDGSASIAAEEQGLGRASLQCPTLSKGLYRVESRLVAGGRVVDRISHEFRIAASTAVAAKDTVTALDGEFVLNGSKWRGVGINFWPLWSAAQEIPDFYHVGWLHPSQYDPQLVERDLSILQKLGMNLVSLLYGQLEHAPALVDFLERCHAHRIKANVFLAGAHPVTENGSLAVKLIRAARLDKSPAVFAYDLGWEVHAGDEKARRKWDTQWRDWVVEQYGSVESAEQDWGYKVTAPDGSITGPTDQQILNDGEWRRMVAAYRRFWDDLICERYGARARMIRSEDPRHLIGVRSGWAGTGSMHAAGGFAYDLVSGVMHLDFTSPEYPGPLREHGISPAGLTTLYGRFVSGGKPVYWAEYGTSLGPNAGPEALEAQAACYRQTYSMMEQTCANAGAGWWYPGGWRIEEGSDYGIINPDGTPRPAALVSAAGFLNTECPPGPPDYFITFDRDLYVSGYAGVYAAHRDEYAKAASEGKSVGLRTAGTGTDSSNVPLVAVGNVPCNGQNPPKYLNADLELVRVRPMNGRWRLVDKSSTIGAASMEIRVVAGNNGDATWLAPRLGLPEGAVYLVARCGDHEWKMPIGHDVAPLSSIEILGAIHGIPEDATSIELRMLAEGRVAFGRKMSIGLARRI